MENHEINPENPGLKFAIVGYGRMGKLVKEVLDEREEIISNVIDPIIDEPWAHDSLKNTDVAICFTSPDAGHYTTRRILSEGVNAVVATTKFYLNEDGSMGE